MHFCSHVFVHICVVFATHRNVTFNYCSSLLDPVSKMNIEFCIYFCIAAVQLQMNLTQKIFIYIFLSEPQDPESVMKQFSSLTNIEIKKIKNSTRWWWWCALCELLWCIFSQTSTRLWFDRICLFIRWQALVCPQKCVRCKNCIHRWHYQLDGIRNKNIKLKCQTMSTKLHRVLTWSSWEGLRDFRSQWKLF